MASLGTCDRAWPRWGHRCCDIDSRVAQSVSRHNGWLAPCVLSYWPASLFRQVMPEEKVAAWNFHNPPPRQRPAASFIGQVTNPISSINDPCRHCLSARSGPTPARPGPWVGVVGLDHGLGLPTNQCLLLVAYRMPAHAAVPRSMVSAEYDGCT